MQRLYDGLEQWLVAERQQMARPTALSAFMTKKDAMLDSIGFDPNDARNVGAAKARSHIEQCGTLVNIIESLGLEGLTRDKKLGDVASKAMKAATGYSMRAGYFHPNQPDELYTDRMIRLIGPNGKKIPVLGVDLQDLEGTALGTVHLSTSGVANLRFLLGEGQTAANVADHNLRGLLLSEKEGFAGSVEAQKTADELTLAVKGLFVAAAIGALRLQQDGPDGLGAIILEPRSDAEANQYLRIERLQSEVIDGITSVSSADAVSRT